MLQMSTLYNANDSIEIPDLIDDYELSRLQSYGFFDDITSAQWKRKAQIVREYIKHDDINNPLVHAHAAPAFYQTNYEPNFSCGFERRIGGAGDGPKWVCDPHQLLRLSEERTEKGKKAISSSTGRASDASAKNAGCLVYSVGSRGEFQFELGLQTFLGPGNYCEIHIFDVDNYEDVTPKNMNMHFHQWGLQSKNTDDDSTTVPTNENGTSHSTTPTPTPNATNGVCTSSNKCLSLEETVKKLGHSERPMIDIFKIDCEGCEWETFKEWFGHNVPMMQQILVEVHSAPVSKVLPFFDGIIDQGYAIFHKEPNIQHGGGECVEYGFLKVKDGFFELDE
jgi:hypothetical protein